MLIDILNTFSNLKHFSCYFKEIPAIELNEKSDGVVAKKYYTRSYKPDDVLVFLFITHLSSMPIVLKTLFTQCFYAINNYVNTTIHCLYIVGCCSSLISCQAFLSRSKEGIIVSCRDERRMRVVMLEVFQFYQLS